MIGPYKDEVYDVLQRIMLADQYYRGIQYKFINSIGGAPRLASGVNVDAFRAAMGLADSDDIPMVLDYVLNFFKGDVDKIMAVMCRAKPYTKAQALFEGIPGVQDVLSTADAVAGYLDKVVDFPGVISKLGSTLLKYPGGGYLLVDYESDEAKYGATDLPIKESTTQLIEGHYLCPECGGVTREEDLVIGEDPNGELFDPACKECGLLLTPQDWLEAQEIEVPEVVEVVKVPNGAVKIKARSGLTVRVPFISETLEEAPFIGDVYQEYAERVKMWFPAHADRIKGGRSIGLGVDSQLASDVTARVASPSGGTMIQQDGVSRVEYARWWVDPCFYGHLKDCGASEEVVARFRELYPSGVRMTIVNGDVLVEMVDMCKEHQWCAVKTGEGDFIACAPAHMEPYLSACDMVNTVMNMVEEVLSTEAPVTIASTEVIDWNALRNSVPGRGGRKILPAKPGAGDLRRGFQDLPVSQPSGTAIQFITMVIDRVREICGVSPALFGAGQYNTAREALVSREQAMAMLQPIYAAVVRAIASGKMLAANLLAKFAGDVVFFPRSPNGNTVAIPLPGLPDILNGGWVYAGDETLPVSPADRRDQIEKLLQNPALQQVLGVTHPDNLDVLGEIIAITDWTLPGKNEVDALHKEIDEIVMGYGQPDLMGIVDPALASEVYRSWLLSEKGARLKRVDREGWERVKEAMAAYQPPPPPPAPEPQGGSFPAEEPPPELPPMGPPPNTPGEAGGPGMGMGPLPGDGQGLPPMVGR
jgi:hypothetical protein